MNSPYNNDSISRITREYYFEDGSLAGSDSYNFNYMNDSTISVAGNMWEGGNATFKLNLNKKGYIESCKRVRAEDTDNWLFEYNDDRQCVKVIKNNKTWQITYAESNAVKVQNNRDSDAYDFSYGVQENLSNLIMLDEIYVIDLGQLEAFGLIGMLGKPSKYLPIAYTGESKTFSWSLDNEGYPEYLSIGNGWKKIHLEWE